MKKYMAFVILLGLLSCKKSINDDVTACGVNDPVRNLKWLNQKYKLFTGGSESNSIVLYEYRGNQIIQVNQAVSSKAFDVYNCNGDALMFDDANGLNNYLAGRKKIKVLYGTWASD
ncbi:MAG: hypothetical protein EOO47_24705 [Flavobacterium sp.]|nr:MAG: hypothetical protein EOO47_24705 [Flavobacterium sp.]